MTLVGGLILIAFVFGCGCMAMLGYFVGSYGLHEIWPWAYRLIYGTKQPPVLTTIEQATGSGRAAPTQLLVDWSLIHSIVDASGMKMVPKDRVH